MLPEAGGKRIGLTTGREMGATKVLEVPLYAISEAARLLAIHPVKLRRWLEGTTVAGRRYPPVIRPEPTGSDTVTWAEFVEASFLREYRGARVSLQHMRPIIDAMRREFRVRYPLAQFKPLIDRADRQLVFEMQEQLGLDDDLRLVRRRGTGWQVQWAPAVEQFLDKLTFDKRGVAQRMHPLGRSSPVVIDPEKVFGIPQIRGVRTETISHAFGIDKKSERAIAREWALSEAEVKAALQWEFSVLKKAA
jgi:uncharacterized protein (DUF433 family)